MKSSDSQIIKLELVSPKDMLKFLDIMQKEINEIIFEVEEFQLCYEQRFEELNLHEVSDRLTVRIGNLSTEFSKYLSKYRGFGIN